MSRRPPTDQQIVEGLLSAYRRGFFPMANTGWPADPPAKIHWFSPDPRGVLPLTAEQGFHLSRRLAQRIRQRPFEIRVDSAFEQTMRGCAMPRRASADEDAGDGSWIDETLIRWYALLHRAGHAHSVEAWARDPATGEQNLVGGLYGLSIGAAFFGESMFCIPRPRRSDGSRHPLDGTDASKVCLVTLVRALSYAGYAIFDTQMVTDHVAGFGGIEIPREEYLSRLATAIASADLWPEVGCWLTRSAPAPEAPAGG